MNGAKNMVEVWGSKLGPKVGSRECTVKLVGRFQAVKDSKCTQGSPGNLIKFYDKFDCTLISDPGIGPGTDRKSDGRLPHLDPNADSLPQPQLYCEVMPAGSKKLE